MAKEQGIDPRRLERLAATARKAGIKRLRLADGTEFELYEAQLSDGKTAYSAPAPVSAPAHRTNTGSLDDLRRRFKREAAQ